VLIRALDDERLLDKGAGRDSRLEASITSLAAGLLFHRRMDDFERLLDLLFRTRSVRGGHGVLLQALAIELPERTFSHALRRTSKARANLVVLRALEDAVRRVDSRTQVRAISKMKAILRERATSWSETSLSSWELGLSAASVLRQIDPNDLTAWDWIAEATLRKRLWIGSVLHPVPAARFGRAGGSWWDEGWRVVEIGARVAARQELRIPRGRSQFLHRYRPSVDPSACRLKSSSW
jgi:hypothetical protein